MKKVCFLLISVFVLALFADEEKPARSIETIQLERDRAFNRLLELRKMYIQKDSHLNKLHKKILELHVELANALDKKEDIREINDKLISLDKELRQIRRQRRK